MTVWTHATKSVTEIDIPSSKDKASYIKWSNTDSVLVIGTEKGTLIFFNKKNSRKIPCVGKHSKRVHTGDWNDEGLLISGSEDRLLAVSNSTGDTVLDQFEVKGEPLELKWAKKKKDEQNEKNKSVSAIMKRKHLILLDVETTNNVEISFSSTYGRIVTYEWFGDGYIAAAFTNGVVSVISTHQDEIGMEI